MNFINIHLTITYVAEGIFLCDKNTVLSWGLGIIFIVIGFLFLMAPLHSSVRTIADFLNNAFIGSLCLIGMLLLFEEVNNRPIYWIGILLVIGIIIYQSISVSRAMGVVRYIVLTISITILLWMLNPYNGNNIILNALAIISTMAIFIIENDAAIKYIQRENLLDQPSYL